MLPQFDNVTVRHIATVLVRRGPWRGVFWQLLLGAVLLTSVSCSSVWTGVYDGVRFTIHQDKRWSRIEYKDGPFLYDSPELTVTAENGRLVINNEDAGELHPGDHVEVTNLGTVLVNGQRRGDAYTGKRALDERLKLQQTKRVTTLGGNSAEAAQQGNGTTSNGAPGQPIQQSAAEEVARPPGPEVP